VIPLALPSATAREKAPFPAQATLPTQAEGFASDLPISLPHLSWVQTFPDARSQGF